MIRFFFLTSLLLLLSILLFNTITITIGNDAQSGACRMCHEEIYMKALKSRYKHSVVMNDCTICHIVHDSENKIMMKSNYFYKKAIFYPGKLLDDNKYQVDVVLTDRDGRDSEPKLINIIPNKIGNFRDKDISLKDLSGVMVEEIKKGLLVEAAISWVTDAPATSEIEYKLKGERGNIYTFEDLFTQEHKIILSDLKHNKKYYFRVISRDIFGNMIQSQEYFLDTSNDFTRVKELRNEDKGLPFVDEIRAFRIGGREGCYLMVAANKPSKFLVGLKEFKQKDKIHGYGLLPARYSRIDVCVKCHPQNASHPVGIRASGPNVRTPTDLPIIEGGVITCVTCHYPHGGENKYFAVMDFDRKICLRCHNENIYR